MAWGGVHGFAFSTPNVPPSGMSVRISFLGVLQGNFLGVHGRYNYIGVLAGLVLLAFDFNILFSLSTLCNYRWSNRYWQEYTELCIICTLLLYHLLVVWVWWHWFWWAGKRKVGWWSGRARIHYLTWWDEWIFCSSLGGRLEKAARLKTNTMLYVLR